ncbi:MAG: class I SAM-dependent methyltransferase [Candidatus Eisenbacteria bacterium]|nr:class I SAM-dependent methyltransferase [Candidatus Eisenbacteria bacterium]
MTDYYSEKLSAERLRAVYDLAPPRTKAYLEAEIDLVLERISPGMIALELGCGYGRVLKRLVDKVRVAVGIDTSVTSLQMARDFVGAFPSLHLAAMNAAGMGLGGRAFDITICIQNGISAFHVDRRKLFAEAVRVTKPGGTVLFSSYSPKFWNHRLEWFEIQAAHGLVGEIDCQRTGNGVIVAKDGFTGTAVGDAEFETLAVSVGQRANIMEVDNSSLFCEITVA